MTPIYILNVSGGHGHFLQWLLDKFCVTTPDINTIPFNHLGASHMSYESSGKFIFIDDPKTKTFLKNNSNKNAIMITIEDEILYWERSCMYRSGDSATDLYDEKSIESFLIAQGSSFPKSCRDKKISIKEGYTYAFQNIEKCGARVHDKERKNYQGIKNNNVYFFPLKNFLSKEDLYNSLLKISNFFKFELNLKDFNDVYDLWYNKNQILQTHNNIKKQHKNSHLVKLDILQQAYVDSYKK